MRAYYVLVVAAATLLASSKAFSSSTDAYQPEVFQDATHSADAVKNAIGNRFLRSNIDKNNNEERAWVHIMGFDRTKPEAKEWLHFWLRKLKPDQEVAGLLGISKFDQSHQNWPALVKYVRMNFKWASEKAKTTKKKITKEEAEAWLATIL